MSDYSVNLDAINAAQLKMNTYGLAMLFVSLAIEGAPILASDYDCDQVSELKNAGLILQSGNSLRFPREIFKFT
jgi:hypothetical protein